MPFISKVQMEDGTTYQLKDSNAVSISAAVADKGKAVIVDNSGQFALGSNGLMLELNTVDSTATVLQDGTDVTSQLPYEKTGKITINGEEKTANVHTLTITDDEDVTTTFNLVGVS